MINLRHRDHCTFGTSRIAVVGICPKTHSKLFLEVDAVLLLLNLTFCTLATFSAPAKRELNGSNDTSEDDIVRNCGV